eukprot:m.346225 g.346225  ORF g.346225 m.346225 type:complete len:514 (+) comp28439_c0_seq1:48-1589(+)
MLTSHLLVPFYIISCLTIPSFSWGPDSRSTHLQYQINTAVAQRATILEINEGIYRFGNSPLLVNNAENLKIKGKDGEKIEFIFDIGGGIKIVNCFNVTVQGISMGYFPVVHTQGKIVHIDKNSNTFIYKADPGFPSLSDKRLFQNLGHPNFRVKVILFDNKTLSQPQPQGNNFVINASAINNTWKVSTTKNMYDNLPINAGVGTPVVLSPRNGASALTFLNSSRCAFASVEMHSYPNVGISDSGGVGGNMLEKVVISRNASSPLFQYLVGNMGALNSNGAFHGPKVIGCNFSHIGDDFFNSHTSIGVVIAREGDSIVLATFDKGHTLLAAQGANVSLYHPVNPKNLQNSSFSPQQLWNGNLLSVNASITNASLQNLAQQVQKNIMRVYGIQLVPFMGFAVEVKVSSSLPEVLPPYAYFQTDSCRGSEIVGNVFFDGFARMGPFKPIGGVVKGNTFRNSHQGGVLVTPDFYFMEGNVNPQDIVVEENVFEDCGTPSVTVCSWCNTVVVRNNSFK